MISVDTSQLQNSRVVYIVLRMGFIKLAFSLLEYICLLEVVGRGCFCFLVGSAALDSPRFGSRLIYELKH